MPLQRTRFVLPTALADQVLSTVDVPMFARSESAGALKRELSFAARRATRAGLIAVPWVGLRLRVYRTTLFGRPYDLVTRTGAAQERVVGIVPAERERSWRRQALDDSILSEDEAAELAFELLGAESEEELDQFLGNVIKKLGKAAKGVARTVSQAGKSIGKVMDAVNKVVPVVSVLSLTPMGMTMRYAKNLGRIAAGENVFKVAGKLVKSGVNDVGKAMQLASTVVSFVPGVGTGVAAALGAAGALAQGRPITEALLEAAKGALPGGRIAAAAFDVASGLARGKNLSEAALSAARNQLPGGAAARAAFDTGLALAQGKKLQHAAMAAAGRLIPPSPFSATALSFANKVASGENLQKAALSSAGNALLQRANAGARSQLGRLSRPVAGRV